MGTPRGDGHLKASVQGDPEALRLHGDRAHTGATPHLPAGKVTSGTRLGTRLGTLPTLLAGRALCSHTTRFISAARPFTSHIFSNFTNSEAALRDWTDSPHPAVRAQGLDSPCRAFPAASSPHSCSLESTASVFWKLVFVTSFPLLPVKPPWSCVWFWLSSEVKRRGEVTEETDERQGPGPRGARRAGPARGGGLNSPPASPLSLPRPPEPHREGGKERGSEPGCLGLHKAESTCLMIA